MNKIEIVENDNNLFKLILNDFIEKELKQSTTFRYYLKRDTDVISNHALTVLFLINKEPIAYGHLDVENNSTWLGIYVSQQYQSQGLGKKMMNYILKKSKKIGCNHINLSVDYNNKLALKLYLKFNFRIVKKSENIIYMKYTNEK